MRSRWFARLLLASAAAVFSLAAAEVVLRITTGDRLLASEPRLISSTLNYVPNQLVKFKHREWSIEIRINSAGFRDEETCDRKGPDDVVMLGDSFVEGYGVAADQTVSKRLESLLSQSKLSRHVYNAGHYATEPRQYKAVYEHAFRGKVPHSTVVMELYVGNDLVGPLSPETLPLPERDSFGYLARVFLGEHLALYNLLNTAAKNVRPLRWLMMKTRLMSPVPEVQEAAIYDPELVDASIRYTIDLIVDFGRQTRADGKTFAVMLIPTREQAEDDWWATTLNSGELDPTRTQRYGTNERLVKGLTAGGVRVIDLTREYLKPAADHTTSYFKTDRHWNPRGHDIAARVLLRSLWPGATPRQ